MSRVTAPASKLARTINTAATSHGSLHHAHGAILMPKYAELLKKHTTEKDSHARGITTTHRPTPQPKPSKTYTRPLMQTFSSTSSSAASALPVLPFLGAETVAEASSIRMPLLPDSYARHHALDAPDAPIFEATISVVAANPGDVLPASALTEVEGMGVDGVELRFVHEPISAQREPGMLTDLWRGLVADITGPTAKTA